MADPTREGVAAKGFEPMCSIHKCPLAKGIGFAPDWCPSCEAAKIVRKVLS